MRFTLPQYEIHIHKLLFIDFMASWKNQWYFIKNIPHWIIGLLKYSLLVVKLSGMCSLSQHFSLAIFHRHLIDSFLMISFALTEFNFHDAFASNHQSSNELSRRFLTVTNFQFFASIFLLLYQINLVWTNPVNIQSISICISSEALIKTNSVNQTLIGQKIATNPVNSMLVLRLIASNNKFR